MPTMVGMTTGETRYRKTWRGRLILQVRYLKERRHTKLGGSVYAWRDADEHDLLHVRKP